MKKQNLKITQENGFIDITRNGELDYKYDCNRLIERIKSDKLDAVSLANHLAEIMYGCLNCKSATAKLVDLNSRHQFSPDGTYFEHIDYFKD